MGSSSTSRIILFGTILAEIPAEISIIPPRALEAGVSVVASHAGVLDLITYSSTDSDSLEDLPAPAISLFFHSFYSSKTSRDSTVSGSLERPPSQDPYEARRFLLVDPIVPSLMRVLKMMTTRKRVRPFPSRHLASRHSSDYSSADSLSERSLTTYVPSTIPALGALSPTRVDLLPPCKRFTSFLAALSLEASIEGSMEIGSEEEDINSDIMADIAAEAAAAAGFRIETNIRFEGDDKAEEEDESSTRDSVEIEIDRIVEPVVPDGIPVHVTDEGSGEYFYVEDRIDSLRRHMSYTQEELRHVHMCRYYDQADFRRLETFATRHLGYAFRTMPTTTRSGMTPAAIEEMIERRVMEALEAYEANINRGLRMESRDEHEDDNGDDHVNRNGGGNRNRRGNGDGNPNMNVGGVVPVTRECTYQDFLKCQPHVFKGTEGVIGLTRWFENTETVYHISNCPPKYQGNNLAAYTQRFQELILVCTKMVPKEEEKVEKFVGGMLKTKGDLIATKGIIVCNNDLLKGKMWEELTLWEAMRKRDMLSLCPTATSENYTTWGNTVKCGNYKKVEHMVRDCKATFTATAQRAPVKNPTSCYLL
ncbi:hypothetical protein Tco_0411293 [Tanacetum coccineum]